MILHMSPEHIAHYRECYALLVKRGYRLVAREGRWGTPGVLYFHWEMWHR